MEDGSQESVAFRFFNHAPPQNIPSHKAVTPTTIPHLSDLTTMQTTALPSPSSRMRVPASFDSSTLHTLPLHSRGPSTTLSKRSMPPIHHRPPPHAQRVRYKTNSAYLSSSDNDYYSNGQRISPNSRSHLTSSSKKYRVYVPNINTFRYKLSADTTTASNTQHTQQQQHAQPPIAPVPPLATSTNNIEEPEWKSYDPDQDNFEFHTSQMSEFVTAAQLSPSPAKLGDGDQMDSIYFESELIRLWDLDEIERTFNAYLSVTLYELKASRDDRRIRYWNASSMAPFTLHNAVSQTIQHENICVVECDNQQYICTRYSVFALLTFDTVEKAFCRRKHAFPFDIERICIAFTMHNMARHSQYLPMTKPKSVCSTYTLLVDEDEDDDAKQLQVELDTHKQTQNVHMHDEAGVGDAQVGLKNNETMTQTQTYGRTPFPVAANKTSDKHSYLQQQVNLQIDSNCVDHYLYDDADADGLDDAFADMDSSNDHETPLKLKLKRELRDHEEPVRMSDTKSTMMEEKQRICENVNVNIPQKYDENEFLVIHDNCFSVDEWRLMDGMIEFDTSEERITIHLKYRRNFGAYLLNVFGVILMIALLAILVTMFDVYSSGGSGSDGNPSQRIVLLCVVLLVMIIFSQSHASAIRMRNIHCVTLMDRFIFASYMYVIGLIAASCLIGSTLLVEVPSNRRFWDDFMLKCMAGYFALYHIVFACYCYVVFHCEAKLASQIMSSVPDTSKMMSTTANQAQVVGAPSKTLLFFAQKNNKSKLE